MTRMAATSLYSKIFEKLLFRNRMTDDLENRYAALVARSLSSLINWCPLIDLDLFKVSQGAFKIKFDH